LFHSARADSKPTASAVPKSSRNNPPKTTTTAPERSQSELPITTEAISKLSVHSSESGLASGARSQTTPRPAYRRRTLYSAVPDTAVLTPIRRPEEYGKAGRPIQIYTNHFKVSIDNAMVNQYDIEIVMIRRDGKTCSARKNERWETLKELAKREKNFPIVW
jgi:hypothetical protein